MATVWKSSLSSPKKRLIELMQTVHYGWIQQLFLKKGEPLFDPAPRVIKDVKLDSLDNGGPTRQIDSSDFMLKTQQVELFNHFAGIGDGVIESIEVKHGLPFRFRYAAR